MLFALIILAAICLLFYLHYESTHLSTDDAFVDGRVHIIAPRVSGPVVKLCVEDNQVVKTGDVLVEIDPRDYQVSLQQAQALLEQERSKLESTRVEIETARSQQVEATANLETARAVVVLNEATLAQAKRDAVRAEALWKGGSATDVQHEQALTARDTAEAQLTASQATVRQLEAALLTRGAQEKLTEKAVPTQEALVRQREAAVATAALALSYTKITAPADGLITRRSVEVGNQVQPGQALMSVVPLDLSELWITANYKETQLNKMRPGQKVRIRVDAYPGLRLEGRVETLMAGTGSVFSLFPAENATGNFVKVVQRVPVKIVIVSGADPDRPLRLGMSVIPTVLTQP